MTNIISLELKLKHKCDQLLSGLPKDISTESLTFNETQSMKKMRQYLNIIERCALARRLKVIKSVRFTEDLTKDNDITEQI